MSNKDEVYEIRHGDTVLQEMVVGEGGDSLVEVGVAAQRHADALDDHVDIVRREPDGEDVWVGHVSPHYLQSRVWVFGNGHPEFNDGVMGMPRREWLDSLIEAAGSSAVCFPTEAEAREWAGQYD